MGWPIPEKKWFEGNLKNWFNNVIAECKICEKLNLKNNSKQLRKKVRKMIVAIWYKKFFEDFNNNRHST